MGHTNYTSRGWTISVLTGFIDRRWSTSFTMQKVDQRGVTAHNGQATGLTEDDALQQARTIAQRWIDTLEAGQTL